MSRILVLTALVWLSIAWATPVSAQGVRFLRWPQVQSLSASASSGAKLPDFATPAAWDTWIRQRDWEVRARTDQMVEDLISSWVVFGTSFTTLQVLGSQADAVNAAGILTPAARSRVDDFINGLDTQDDERWRAVLEYLRRRRVTEEELPAFLGGILRRCAIDRRNEGGSPHPAALLTDFAMSETLRLVKNSGRAPAKVRRVAVIAPAMDFSGGPDGYDFFPLQTIQPFALLEAVERLDLAHAGDVQLSAFDLNPFALAHLRTIAGRVHSPAHYILELPLNMAAGWNAAAMSYWNRFGELIGGPAEPVPAPPHVHNVTLRAIAVKPQAAGHITVNDLDIVAQSIDSAPGQAFDIVVALNALSLSDRMEQTLAMANIAGMMNPGAILLLGVGQAASVPPELESLGSHRIVYSERGLGIEMAVYRRR